MFDPAQCERIIKECFQVQVRTARPIQAGWSSFVLLVNDELIFRFPRRPEIEAGLEKEIRLLPELAQALPVSVPHFEFIWRGGPSYDGLFVGYKKIAGVPLESDSLSSDKLDHLARHLVVVLSALHRFPVQQATRLQVPGGSADRWRQEYREFYAWIQHHIVPLLEPLAQAATVALWEGFLADDAHFQFRPVLIHRDLGGEHILCDAEQGLVAGIIDWEDAAIGDPALDFVGLHCDVGREFAEQVLSGYQGQVDKTFWPRVIFYSSIIPFYEIQFGLTTGNKAHVDHGLERLQARLQPATPCDTL
jgi:aminoglycoside 2''-phosphotransferase